MDRLILPSAIEGNNAEFYILQNSPKLSYLFDFLVVLLYEVLVVGLSLLNCIHVFFDRATRLCSRSLKLVCPRANFSLKLFQLAEYLFQSGDQGIDLINFHRFRRFHLSRILCAGFLCQALYACEKPQITANTAPKAQTSPNQFVLKNVSAERFSQGQRKFQATARKANIDRRSGKITANDVIIHTKEAEAKAQSAIGNLNEEEVYFEKQIVVTDQTGRTIQTEQATFNTAKSLLVSNSTVTLDGKNFSAKGQNLEADFQRKTIKVDGPLKSVFTPQ